MFTTIPTDDKITAVSLVTHGGGADKQDSTEQDQGGAAGGANSSGIRSQDTVTWDMDK